MTKEQFLAGAKFRVRCIGIYKYADIFVITLMSNDEIMDIYPCLMVDDEGFTCSTDFFNERIERKILFADCTLYQL